MQNYPTGTDGADTFKCHASEDKESIARPLRDALKEIGINAWLDEYEVQVGDSIRRKIDQGLATCRSATVILSRTFFEKYWDQYEMGGIFQRQVPGEIPIFARAGTLECLLCDNPPVACRSVPSTPNDE